MAPVLAPVADLLVTAGVVLGGLAWWATRSWAQALGVTLDLVLAATLLRLTGFPEWRLLGTTVAVVAVRLLVRQALATARQARRETGDRGPGALSRAGGPSTPPRRWRPWGAPRRGSARRPR